MATRLITTPASLRVAGRLLLALVSVLVGSCAGADAPRAQSPSQRPAPIRVDWSDPTLSRRLEDGWSLRNCRTESPALCVARDGAPAGSIAMKDVPSLGEEKTTSADQVQAVLAGRINSLYEFKKGRWASECGRIFSVRTDRPRTIKMGDHAGMKYELSARRKNSVVVERVAGYWAFREGIETVIEARASLPARCDVEQLGQIPTAARPELPEFSPQLLSRFMPLLDRIVAGSNLPEPTRFTADPKPNAGVSPAGASARDSREAETTDPAAR